MKFHPDNIYGTANTLEVKVNQTGNTAMISEKGEEKATKRQGFRVLIGNSEIGFDTIGYGSWDKSEKDLLLDVIKKEHYAHRAYKELYYDLLKKLASIGFVQANEDDSDDRF